MAVGRPRNGVLITQRRTITLSNPQNAQALQPQAEPDLGPQLGDEEDFFSDTDSEEGNDEAEEDGEEEEEGDESESEDEGIAEDGAHPHGQHDATPEAGPSTPRNKFMFALTSAAQQYSARLRSRPSLLMTPPTPLHLNLLDAADSSTPEFVSDHSDGESDFSSEDEYDNELFMNRAKFSKQEAEKLFYNPAGPWSSVANEPIENPVVIAKLHSGIMCDASIKRGTLGGKPIIYVSKTWALTQSWRGFFSEMTLYSHSSYLRSLQGIFVPRIIGLYLVDGAVSVAMELPSSSFWVEASEDMSNHLKRKCIAAFDAIHAQGVLHNDVELRHMLVSADGHVTIIDFQESCALNPVPEVGLKQATEADIRLEKRKIKFKLGYEDCRQRELEKRIRVRGRLQKLHDRALKLKRGEPVDPIETIEPEHPDDVENPIVNSTIWVDCWVGQDETEPEAYIIPGQDEVTVNAFIQAFLGDELDRQESDRARAAAKGLVQRVQTAQLPDVNPVASAPSASAAHLHTPSPSPPLPSNKRKRELADEDEVLDLEAPPAKRQQLPSEISNLESELAPVPAPSDEADAPEPELIDGLPASEHPDNMTDVIYVPFEGYDGPGGFTIPNIYSAREVAEMRCTWIHQYNIERCKEEGLPYPVAARYDLTPNTEVAEFIIGKAGKRRKRRFTTSRGALKRAQIERENPGQRIRDAEAQKTGYLRQRHVPGTGLSDSEDEQVAGPSHIPVEDDGIPEGPKIMTWNELPEEERSRLPTHFAEPSDPPRRQRLRPSSEFPAPKRGIMRRQLSPETKAKQLEYDAWLKKHAVEDPEEEEEDLQGTQRQPASSHGRMPSGIKRGIRSSSSRPDLPPSPVSAPTEENLRKLNALASKRSGKSKRSPSPSEDSNDSTMTMPIAGPSQLRGDAADIPSSPSPRGRSSGRTRVPKASSSRAKGKNRRRADSPASDVASVGGVPGGLASDRNCELPVSHWDPDDYDNSPFQQRPDYDDPNFDDRRFIGAYIPLAERSLHIVSPEEQADMDDVEKLVEVDERHGMWGWLSSFGNAFSPVRR